MCSHADGVDGYDCYFVTTLSLDVFGKQNWSFSLLLAFGMRVLLLVIWLILPELMCYSQRLSHACLSLNDLIVKPRTAHYNRYYLLDLESILLG